jgi:hypothetical protein
MTKGSADDELAGVAVIGASDDAARAIVERLLDAAGIAAFLEGSVVYSIQVRPGDLDRAREILRSSTDLEHHWIQFPAE